VSHVVDCVEVRFTCVSETVANRSGASGSDSGAALAGAAPKSEASPAVVAVAPARPRNARRRIPL
jgi:hypothetical protein